MFATIRPLFFRQQSNNLPISYITSIWPFSDNNSIWAQVVNVRDIDFDFDQMEELFCQKQAQIKKPASPNTSDTAKSSPVKSVSLLDSKRSLTINIFLRQFKNGIPEVIGKVENAQNMNVDSLRGLLKILPDSDEVSSSYLKKKPLILNLDLKRNL